MPMIIVQANQPEDDAGRVTLSERVIATQLPDEHRAAQLIERLGWAAIDAKRRESPTDSTDRHLGPRPIRPSHRTVSSRPVAITLRDGA